MTDNSNNLEILISTSYFPPLEYMAELVHAKKATLDIHETYSKQTWRNRCTILSGNGPVNLSIPVEKPNGNATKTVDVIISRHYTWRKNHWRTIHSAYRNAPFFIYYNDLVEQLIMDEKQTRLHELNKNILQALLDEMNVDVSLHTTSEFIREPAGFKDLRFCISPKQRERAAYQTPGFSPYYQIFEDRFGFVPNLTILDLLFNLGPDSAEYLKNAEVSG